MWCAIRKQELVGPVFVEGTTKKNQRYLQLLQNLVILVIQGAVHVEMFFQHDCARLHTVNVVLDVLHDVSGSYVLSNRFSGRFGCEWSWPPCS